MIDTIIVGGGPAGLTAAITLSRQGKQVLILERNKSCLKKLLITGNGHCNYWNENQDHHHYHTTNDKLISTLLSDTLKEQAYQWIESLGIVPRIKNGYYYPFSNQATSMKEALLTEAHRLGVQIITEAMVTKIEKQGKTFYITTPNQTYTSLHLVLATGSKAYPKTGSDGSGYQLAEMLGHTIIPSHPSLVQLEGMEKYAKDWSGVRADVIVSLYENHKKIKEESGELQFTDYGLSGICIFNLSRNIAIYQDTQLYEIHIKFTPWAKDQTALDTWFQKREKALPGRTFEQMLEGFLHYKVIHVIAKKMHITPDYPWNHFTKSRKIELYQWLLDYPIRIYATKGFDFAQVCSGGVSLEEIHLHSLESKKVPGLYFVGELLDVDGDCGGYNLGFAWMSGLLVGKHIGEQHD